MSRSLRFQPDRLIPLLERRIPDIMTRNAVPGLSAALFHDAALVWSKGFGVRNNVTQQPVTTQTIFEGASLSKPMVAYAALHLCSSGALALDQPLAAYLTEDQRAVEPVLAPITLRHVLSHTTGLPNWRPQGQPLRLLFTPGARFGYSGEGYEYLQRVIEQVTGQRFDKYLQETIFDPFEMNASSYTWRSDYADKIAIGHESDGSLVEKWQPQEPTSITLHTTAEDVARFMINLFAPSVPEQGAISGVLRKAMFSPQIGIDDAVSWGLGWGLCLYRHATTIWQWGDNISFTAFAFGWPEQQSGVVLMTNSVFGLQACRDILTLVIGEDYPAFPWLMNSFYGSTS
jgi:CubicO group peptidase (beta-lactamase class C family)